MNTHLGVASKTSGPPRFVLVDAFRFLCAAWVMWVHLPQSDAMISTTEAARFRLGFFVLLAVFFQQYQLTRRPAGDFTNYAWDRMRRLYLPFLGWGVLYYFAGGIHRLITNRQWPALTPDFFLHGASIHLWFIPFILVIGLLTYPVSRWLLQHRQWAWMVIGAGGLVGLASCIAAPLLIARFLPATPTTDPVYREVELLPCVPLGFACFFLYMEFRQLGERTKHLLYMLAGMVVAAGFGVDALLYRGALVQNLVAAGMVVLTLRPSKWPLWQILGRWGKYSFGMYAVHIFFVEGMHVLRQMVLHFPPTWWYDLLSFGVCVPASLLATMALSRFPATRWLVPTGEKRSAEAPAPVIAAVGELQGV